MEQAVELDPGIETSRDFELIDVYFAICGQAAIDSQPEFAELACRRATELVVETDDARLNNNICWDGSIDACAGVVLPSCERTVGLAIEAEIPPSISTVTAAGWSGP